MVRSGPKESALLRPSKSEAPIRVTRRYRQSRRRQLADRGITPTRRSHVYRVDIDGAWFPDWVEKARIQHFSHSEDHVWMRLRSDAKLIQRYAKGEDGEVEITKTEYRRCGQCGREFLGMEAERLRMLIESCRTGDQLPCNPDCRPKLWRDKAAKERSKGL